MNNDQDELTKTELSSSVTDQNNEMSNNKISTKNISPIPVDNPHDE